ncbi:ribonuclease E/G [Lutimaribacter sp. EGI FJ00015]|uniref:Ribonuclease E/G n=1 Tax=Lutimaribacter degradans TaxID=2945989 RepID=A0ACC5ZT47_9RHOB|nr:ribonuclease E/G [Lutimaribacter sp. EGI FJ00013]MCM2561467.1 ribonuclease E/G [Lutimaribacter sp. EGI FJ00013]MCO0612822.1 ribonuclease E/G [Lutimaribacter sp. EGI FJ00015]MCO0635480.1 ribonuclease E/G [Lutimaribacter sp. EGI FJ00014]
MKGRQIILDTLDGREAAALMVDGRLDDLLVDGDGPRVGAIYRAVAERPMKGQGGLFLSTPDGKVFLRQVRGVSPGQRVLVQATGHAEPGKAMPVTQKILFKSRYAIVTPGAPGLNISRKIRDDSIRDQLLEIAHEVMDGEAMGLILRSSCVDAAPDDIAADIAAMADLARAVMADDAGEMETLVEGDGPHALAWRDWTDPAEVITESGGFATHGVLERIDAARSPHVSLAGGGSLYIEPTRALVAVDVNTGTDTTPAAALKANIAAARDLPRQLRVRGLGGQVTLDVAPMPKKDRRAFETALRAAFRADAVETTLAGWTPLGHYELQRKRERRPLSEVLS